MKLILKKFGLLLLLSLLFWGCSTSQYYNLKEVRKQIDLTLHDPQFSQAHWGFLIESLDTGEILYQHNADKMFIPASNQKIITSAATLLTLGADFRFETKLYHSGEIVDSVLTGDLIVQGFGDPTFNQQFYNDPRQSFRNWADSLLALGIKRIAGNIIGDDNAFDDNGLGRGWMYDDLGHSYAAETGALQFNANSLKLQILPPASTKGSVKIYPEFKSNYFSILNKTTISKNKKTKLYINRNPGGNKITVSGNCKIGDSPKWRSVSISNPTSFFVNVFKEILIEKGIRIEGKALDCDEIADWNIIHENVEILLIHQSPPFVDILKAVMKDSKNLYAETMVKTLGWQEGEIGSFQEGKEVVQKTLSEFGIAPQAYSYNDGSGLSRYNLFSPLQIVQILKEMRNSEYCEIWRDSFPLAGVDGTLKYRLKWDPAKENISAKTGTMANVRCLSGYLQTESGEEVIFSILVNGHLRKSKEIDQTTDQILKVILEKIIKK
jgi:serine-type D-Ala-D-Ala carboxypeptidase/endopeptidase (penicillin-binding protein 4)